MRGNTWFFSSLWESRSKNVSGALFVSQQWPNPGTKAVGRECEGCWRAEGEIPWPGRCEEGMFVPQASRLQCWVSIQFSHKPQWGSIPVTSAASGAGWPRFPSWLLLLCQLGDARHMPQTLGDLGPHRVMGRTGPKSWGCCGSRGWSLM